MKYLITGSNGYIGSHLTNALLEKGHSVHAYVYPGTDTSTILKKGVKIFTGDIRDSQKLATAVQGCEAAFHLASYVGQWAKNPQIFHDVNVNGTQNLLEVCLQNGLKRVLVSSSCGIFGPSKNGVLVDETKNNFDHLSDPYERSKYHQVKVAKKYLDQGLEVVFVYPTRVFGPGIQSDGNSLTAIFEGVLQGTWRIIPGNGKSYGNYIFVKDVVEGMVLALEKGEAGEGYILGGHNLTSDELFKMVQKITGLNSKLTHVPYPLMWLAGVFSELKSKLTGKKPFITMHSARKFTSDWKVANHKIRHSLGFEATPMETALELTFQSIRKKLARRAIGKLQIPAVPPGSEKRKSMAA